MIAKNLQNLYDEISLSTKGCGRSPDAVRLVAVSKRFPVACINEAAKAGQILFGENYIQEAKEKWQNTGSEIKYHFIGHLQSNKAKIAAQIFSMIETVDSVKLARALNRHAEAAERSLDILIQVNIGNDESKSGIAPENAETLLGEISSLSHLKARGLMTMPPWTENPENARPYFRDLRRLSEKLQQKNLFYDNNNVELSMGMSADFKIAIEEGATLIRIGTSIFGQRQ